MDKRDFRSIGRSARVIGVERRAVNIWLKCYRAEGNDGLRVSPFRGKGLLSEAEAGKVRAWITDTEGCGSIVFSRTS